MTPYIIALAALALLLARTARKRPRGNGYRPKGPAAPPPPPPTSGSNAQLPKVIGTCINVDEDEKGVTFKILLADDQTENAWLQLRHTTEDK